MLTVTPSTGLAQDVFDDDPPEGTPLTAEELEATGRTMAQGKHLVSVLGRYRYGATDQIQVGTNGWEWIGGPNLNVGFEAYSDDKHAIRSRSTRWSTTRLAPRPRLPT